MINSRTKDFQEQEARIIVARSRLYMQEAWFGGMLNHLGYKITDNPNMPTCCTNGKVIYFNIDFVKKCTLNEIVFIIGHEILHCLLNHFLRRTRDRKVMLWNFACDYAVNDILIQSNVGKALKNILHDTQYRNMTAEEVYKILEGKAQDALSKLGRLVDIHMEPQDGDKKEDSKGKGSKDGKDKEEQEANSGYGKEGSKDRKSEENEGMDEKTSNKWNELLEEGIAESSSDTPGIRGTLHKSYGQVIRVSRDKYDCTVDWREELHEFIKTKFESDLTYMKPLKKTQSQGITMPSIRKDERLVIAIALDTSGSMYSHWIEKFIAEIQGILSSYDSFFIHLWCFDTSVHNYTELDSGEVQALEDYQIAGGGGTEFQVNWDLLEDNGIKPDMMLILTDGQPGGTWGDEDSVDTLFAIIGEGNRNVVAPFGKTIFVEIEED